LTSVVGHILRCFGLQSTIQVVTGLGIEQLN